MEEKYITIAEAGRLIGLSTARIYQLIKKHKLTVHYRRDIQVCKESDILKFNKITKSKFQFADKETD